MAKILITSGPTRQYLDPVRYLTNASSGRMGSALAFAAREQGHEVIVVSGPVNVEYPQDCQIVSVTTTQEMLDASLELFPGCEGLIGVAAPCDYMPKQVHSQKINKTGHAIQLELIETPDIVATLASVKRTDQWVVGFALETEDQRFRAVAKMQRKCCNMMISNGPLAMNSDINSVEILASDGKLLEAITGKKKAVAQRILHHIHHSLVQHP